ncbi:MAG: response regulator, partial [Gemmatimonadetes bacterium]|nr:response regulator [Gemmatimonadota bacterium]
MTDPAKAAAAAQALEALRQRYRATIGNTLEAFRALAARLGEQPDAAEVVESVRRELHRVRGTAGSYGFAEASRLSGVMEERAVRWAGDPRLEASERAAMLTRYVAALKAAFDEGVAPAEAPAPSAARRLLAVDLPPAFASALVEEGRLRGYDVLAKPEGQWSPAQLRAASPHVVATTVGSAVAVHDAMGQSSLPLIVLEDGSDAEQVRRAARLPGARVLHAADDPTAVFDMVTRAAGRTSWAGATVLVCDDDPDVLALVRVLVEESGMRVHTLDDPLRLVPELEQVRPSLLLLDINLGQADGIALARTVRGVEAFATLPIIIFSTQTDARTRQRALEAGADEFLPKPIVGAELRARITVRLDAERLRRLDEGRHPGTGLFLSDRLRAAVGEEVARLRAREAPAAVAWVRPAGPAPSGAGLAAWHAEARRVADRVAPEASGRLAGYGDDVALAILGREAPGLLEAALTDAAASRGA